METKMADPGEEIVLPTTSERMDHTPSPDVNPDDPPVKDPDPSELSVCEQAASVDVTAQSEIMQDGGAEWEVDSSPPDSSSDSDSTSDTNSDSDEDDDADADGEYALLSPEEQARILMQGDGGSDDEGPARNGAKGEAAQLRTANEKAEEVVPKPDIKVTDDMKVEELGAVEAIVEKTVLVKAKVSGEYRVLETNSLLCLQDRSVIGVVAETLGRVEQPMYTIRFTNDEAIKDAGLAEKNTPVYYVPQHSTFVFTQHLRAVKGSDASNVHDEEVAADEMEFSDDEAEAENRRQLKLRKQGRKDERNDRSGNPRGRRGGPTGFARINGSANGHTTSEINYEDTTPTVDDGYTPLARPTNLHEMMGREEAPLEGRQPFPPFADRGHDRGHGRGHDRGRGRGRGRGDRGNRGGRWGRSQDGGDRHSNSNPRDRTESFSSRHQRSPVPKSEPNSPGAVFYGQQPHQQTPTATFALPPIPPPSQYPYPPLTPQQARPPFSYPNPAPPLPPIISPQPASYPSYSPSPISPLPQSHFNFNNYATQYNQQPSSYNPYYQPPQQQQPHQPHQQQPHQQQHPNPQWQHQYSTGVVGTGGQHEPPQLPPPGSHINPAFFDALRQQTQNGAWPGGPR